MSRFFVSLCLCGCFFAVACGKKYQDAPPLSPQESLKTFSLTEDFRVELFAAEPHVVDPVEMAFDENGRVYVAEMLDYPDDPPSGRPARSLIKLLDDADGDGRIDRSVVFADQVLQVSGLLPWKGGLLVTSAPDILFMQDTNGDGRADVRRVLYTGFPKVNSESRITNLRLGIDNWIYASNSGADGKITSPEHPERPPILVRGTDFRFRPDRGLAEPASGPAQFGSTFDDWGNRFITQNTIHIRHVVFPMPYLMRAPLLGVPAVAQDISDHGRPSARMFPATRPQAWREARTRIRQHRHHENQFGQVEHVGGYITAASGGTVYTGDAFPEEYRTSVFTGDVSGNLVHRDVLVPDGVSFSARRSKDNVEFLTSTDVWSRICSFANAPDGNLYMTDMYREFIETPESIPEEIKKGMNFWSGDDQGRIYRIVPNRPRNKRNLKPNLGSATTVALVAELSSTNGWHRQTAQRLLVHRQDMAAVPLLKDLAANAELPQARLHALWTLEALSALEPPEVLRALKDAHPAVREHALRLAEPLVEKSNPLAGAVLALEKDPEPRVRFQAALTLGELKPARDRHALGALARLASRHAEDKWFRMAVLTSASEAPLELFQAMRAGGAAWKNADFLGELASLIGARQDAAEISGFLNTLAGAPQPEVALAGLARGLRMAGARSVRVSGADAALGRFISSEKEEVNRAAWDVAQYLEARALVERAAAGALAEKLPVEKRAAATRALRGGSFAAVGPVLRRILESPEPAELQAAAVDTLAVMDDASIGPLLIARWPNLPPPVREKAVDALLNQPDRIRLLLKALEDKELEPTAIEAGARARLIENSDAAIAGRARRIFADLGSDRAKLVASYRDVISAQGDVERGKQVFEKNCARCHMPRRKGGARVGSDLSGVNNKTKEELLTSILHPSYSIEPRFVNYLVTTKEGRMFDGVIANETPAAITLRDGSDEGDEIILRKNIAEIRASRISLMPDNLERSLSRQDLADLIAHLRAGL